LHNRVLDCRLALISVQVKPEYDALAVPNIGFVARQFVFAARHQYSISALSHNALRRLELPAQARARHQLPAAFPHIRNEDERFALLFSRARL